MKPDSNNKPRIIDSRGFMFAYQLISLIRYFLMPGLVPMGVIGMGLLMELGQGHAIQPEELQPLLNLFVFGYVIMIGCYLALGHTPPWPGSTRED